MQEVAETGDILTTTFTDAPPSYVMAVHYTPLTPSPLTFSIPATEGETVSTNLPPPYSEVIEQDEDHITE